MPMNQHIWDQRNNNETIIESKALQPTGLWADPLEDLIITMLADGNTQFEIAKHINTKYGISLVSAHRKVGQYTD